MPASGCGWAEEQASGIVIITISELRRSKQYREPTTYLVTAERPVKRSPTYITRPTVTATIPMVINLVTVAAEASNFKVSKHMQRLLAHINTSPFPATATTTRRTHWDRTYLRHTFVKKIFDEGSWRSEVGIQERKIGVKIKRNGNDCRKSL
ncbi:hypothetical protein MBLNU457_4753t1 [Dothideomycetes sp. NU457]